MEVNLSAEQQALLNDYAKRHGQDAAAALEEVVAAALVWEQQEFQEGVEGIRRGYDDVKAGRTRPAAEFMNELREKHGLPS
jgi:hypothetical protein